MWQPLKVAVNAGASLVYIFCQRQRDQMGLLQPIISFLSISFNKGSIFNMSIIFFSTFSNGFAAFNPLFINFYTQQESRIQKVMFITFNCRSPYLQQFPSSAGFHGHLHSHSSWPWCHCQIYLASAQSFLTMNVIITSPNCILLPQQYSFEKKNQTKTKQSPNPLQRFSSFICWYVGFYIFRLFGFYI